MICEINDKRQFYVEIGQPGDEVLWNDLQVICMCGSFRFARMLAEQLWNEIGLSCQQRTQSCENCPYVVLANKGQSKAKITTARHMARAFAIGIESHYLFNLD